MERNWSKGFGFRVNSSVEVPLGATQALLKLNVIVRMTGKEGAKFS